MLQKPHCPKPKVFRFWVQMDDQPNAGDQVYWDTYQKDNQHRIQYCLKALQSFFIALVVVQDVRN